MEKFKLSIKENRSKLALMGLTFGVGLLWKFGLPPESANELYASLKSINETPPLQALGVTAFGLYNIGAFLLGAKTLERQGFNSGIKTSAAFNILNRVFPGKIRENAYIAESLNLVYNFVGLVHFGAISKIVQPLGLSPIEFILAQRLTSIMVNGPINTGFNLLLLHARKNKQS